ncbi:MAG: PAN domain-containing protein [Pararhodobacter sp.]
MAAFVVLAQPAVAQSPGAQGLACLQLVEALAQDGRVALRGVEFDFNRASLRPDSLPALIAARDAILTLGGDWRIEGHTDNRGSRDYNQALSEARALAVRDWLAAAGVPGARLAVAGFSFERPVADNATDAGRAQNRRVELVGAVSPDMLGFGGPAGMDPCPDTLVPGTHGQAQAEGAPPPPAIAEWTGSGGQEWLPFSFLMATGYGGESGWRGDRLAMPPGTQPQACQALCTAQSECAAFSFEPAGANFVAQASCALIGYGTEVTLRRDNSYLDGGAYHASGLKPDARLLTPESEELARQILADMTEIAALRARARIIAPDAHAPEAWMDVAVDGAVPGNAYHSYLEIAELGDYAFDWRNSKAALFVHDMADGRSGQIWVPEPGEYVLRYVINHPTAALHTIVEQPFSVHADVAASGSMPAPGAPGVAAPVRGGSVEPGIDRPGMDIAMTPMSDADPLACQALCAGEPDCRAWTYVNPGQQGEQAVCWTKSGVPEGFENPCCISGVMDQAAASLPPTSLPPASPADGPASLSFPMVVEPGEGFAVRYSGPLHSGDWIDMISPGNDDDMSGGWGWAWATGDPAMLTAPATEGEYTLRYVAEDPTAGRVVLARDTLVVRARPAVTVAQSEMYRYCEGATFTPCEIRLDVLDLSLSLMPGYAITEPLAPATAAGPVPGRPGFDLVRLSDGVAIASVNPRQGSSVLCIPGLLDQVCSLGATEGMDALALMSLAGSLTTVAMAQESDAMGEDGPVAEAGAMQGVWWFSADMPGTPEDQAHFIVLELMQDAGDVSLSGSFVTSPEVGPLRGMSGDVAGVIAGDTLNLTMSAPDGVTGLVFSGTEYGGDAWRGQIHTAHAPLLPPYGAILRKIAGPGEEWSGAPWMTGEADGMAAALQMGQQAIQGMLGGLQGEDRTMAEMLGGMMGALAGAETSPTAPAGASASPTGAALGGRPVDLGGMPADALIEFLLPFRSAQP